MVQDGQPREHPARTSFAYSVQSAIFFVLACTPCNQVSHRRKAKIKAKREAEDKARVIAEQPHLYHHPDPFHTNPYWSEEIRMGPSLPKKGKGGASNKSSSQRGLTTTESRDLASVGTISSIAVHGQTDGAGIPSETKGTKAPSPPLTALHGIGSAPTVVPEEDTMSTTLSNTVSVSTGDGWNLKRYQREDEELWGYEFTRTGQKLMDALKQAGSTAGRFVESKLGIEKEVTDEDRYNFYFTPKNPPVNDYHPPVVSSKPMNKEGLMWMLQPPPPAKVMEGKVPVRSLSVMSRNSRRTIGTPDGRLNRLRTAENPFDQGGLELSTPSLVKTLPRRTTASTTRSRLRDRNYSISDSDESAVEKIQMERSFARRLSYRPALDSDFDTEASELDEDPRASEHFSSNPHHAAKRPKLPTIMSTEATNDSLSQRTVQTISNSVTSNHNNTDSSKEGPTPPKEAELSKT